MESVGGSPISTSGAGRVVVVFAPKNDMASPELISSLHYVGDGDQMLFGELEYVARLKQS
jgi:hypothetical protein